MDTVDGANRAASPGWVRLRVVLVPLHVFIGFTVLFGTLGPGGVISIFSAVGAAMLVAVYGMMQRERWGLGLALALDAVIAGTLILGAV